MTPYLTYQSKEDSAVYLNILKLEGVEDMYVEGDALMVKLRDGENMKTVGTSTFPVLENVLEAVSSWKEDITSQKNHIKYSFDITQCIRTYENEYVSKLVNS